MRDMGSFTLGFFIAGAVAVAFFLGIVMSMELVRDSCTSAGMFISKSITYECRPRS